MRFTILKKQVEYGTIDVYDMNLVNMDRHIFGKVSKMCGEAAFSML